MARASRAPCYCISRALWPHNHSPSKCSPRTLPSLAAEGRRHLKYRQLVGIGRLIQGFKLTFGTSTWRWLDDIGLALNDGVHEVPVRPARGRVTAQQATTMNQGALFRVENPATWCVFPSFALRELSFISAFSSKRALLRWSSPFTPPGHIWKLSKATIISILHRIPFLSHF